MATFIAFLYARDLVNLKGCHSLLWTSQAITQQCSSFISKSILLLVSSYTCSVGYKRVYFWCSCHKGRPQSRCISHGSCYRYVQIYTSRKVERLIYTKIQAFSLCSVTIPSFISCLNITVYKDSSCGRRSDIHYLPCQQRTLEDLVERLHVAVHSLGAKEVNRRQPQ